MSAEVESVNFGPAVKLHEKIHSLVDTPVVFNPDGIPEEMKSLKQWVCWAKIKKTEKGGATKAPVAVSSGVLHTSKWGDAVNRKTFDAAYAEFQRYPDFYHGVGFISFP